MNFVETAEQLQRRRMVTETVENAELAMHKHAKRLSATLRRQAYQAGWPSSVARFLQVSYVNGIFAVGYPKQAAKEIEDLEYGTQDNPPSPVILRFMNRIDEYSAPLDEELDLEDLVIF